MNWFSLLRFGRFIAVGEGVLGTALAVISATFVVAQLLLDREQVTPLSLTLDIESLLLGDTMIFAAVRWWQHRRVWPLHLLALVLVLSLSVTMLLLLPS